MRIVRHFMAVLSIALCLYLFYGVLQGLDEYLKSRSLPAEPSVLQIALEGTVFLLPIIFLQVHLNRTLPGKGINGAFYFYYLAYLVVNVSMIANFSAIDLPSLVELDKQYLYAHLVRLVMLLTVIVLYAVALAILAGALRNLTAFDPKLKPYMVFTALMGVASITIVGLVLIPALQALAYGLLGIYFFTAGDGVHGKIVHIQERETFIFK